MSMSAGELADAIVEKRIRFELRAYEIFKQKIIDATTRMIADMSLYTEIDVEGSDLEVLGKVTENLREMGYKFRFIEVQDTSGVVVKHKLHLSVEHLR